MVDFGKLIRRYDERGNLLHTPKPYTTKDLAAGKPIPARVDRAERPIQNLLHWMEYTGERRC